MPTPPKPGGARRRLPRVEETSAGGFVLDRRVRPPRAALIARHDRHGHLVWSLPKGHLEAGETTEDAAVREVWEETGIDALAPDCVLTDWQLENVYDIWPEWRHRYAPGVTRNRERVFGLTVPTAHAVQLNPREHVAWQWLPWRAAADLCYSASNAEACLWLPRFLPPR